MTDSRKNEYISGVCAQCGAPLRIDPSTESGKCEYCDTPFVTSREIHKYTTINNIHNSNDTYHVQYGKKGFTQSAFEYMGKRAEAREKAIAEAKAKVAVELEKQRLAELEAMERARIKEEKAAESRKKFWRGLGLAFLWIYFFPIMLVVTIVKKATESKNDSNDLSPKKASPSLAYIVVGLIIIGVMFPIVSNYSTTGAGSIPTTSVPSHAQTSPTPTTSNNEKWYNRKPITIKSASFSEETATQECGNMQFDVPASWRKRDDGDKYFFYPFENDTYTYLFVMSAVLDQVNFDNLSEADYYYVLDQFISGLLNGGGDEKVNSNASIVPALLRDRRVVFIEADYKNIEHNATGKALYTLIPTHNQIFMISSLMTSNKENLSVDDYCAVLQSLRSVE